MRVNARARVNFLRNHLTSVGWVIWFDIILLGVAHLWTQINWTRAERKKSMRHAHKSSNATAITKVWVKLNWAKVKRFFQLYFLSLSVSLFSLDSSRHYNWMATKHRCIYLLYTMALYIYKFGDVTFPGLLTLNLIINAEILWLLCMPLIDQRREKNGKKIATATNI